MKRSEVNGIMARATEIFLRHGWALPPVPKWDITDFGWGEFRKSGLVLVNLAEEEEYCEKLMLAEQNQHIPAHTHGKKKEDIISRFGTLAIQMWNNRALSEEGTCKLRKNGVDMEVPSGHIEFVPTGERVTLVPGVFHAFWPIGEYTVIGEVSTKNDDVDDNVFSRDDVGRFPTIEEDVPALRPLISE